MAKKTANHSIDPTNIDVQPNERWTEEHARTVLHACQSRGESLVAFARRHGLSPQRLYWWSRRLQVPEREREPAPERALVPIVVTKTSRAIELPIVLRLGPVVVEVHEPEHVPTAWLATLVRDLGEVLE